MSLIYKALISLRSLHPYNSITSQRPHLWMPFPWESAFHHMKFLGDTKAETIADTKVIWLILPRGCRHPLSTASSSPASPCTHFMHSITLGFPSPGQSSVSSISYSAYSVFPSPLLRPRGPTRKCRCVHFCKVPSVSLSGSSFLGHVGTV